MLLKLTYMLHFEGILLLCHAYSFFSNLRDGQLRDGECPANMSFEIEASDHPGRLGSMHASPEKFEISYSQLDCACFLVLLMLSFLLLSMCCKAYTKLWVSSITVVHNLQSTTNTHLDSVIYKGITFPQTYGSWRH